mgnify:CR=1 FL=1
MQQIEIDVINAKPAQAGIERAEGWLVAVVDDPQLRGDEDLAAVDP